MIPADCTRQWFLSPARRLLPGICLLQFVHKLHSSAEGVADLRLSLASGLHHVFALTCFGGCGCRRKESQAFVTVIANDGGVALSAISSLPIDILNKAAPFLEKMTGRRLYPIRSACLTPICVYICPCHLRGDERGAASSSLGRRLPINSIELQLGLLVLCTAQSAPS